MRLAGIIFDGDDTLWETYSFYKEAKKEFFSEMAKLGFIVEEVEKVFQSTDLKNVDKLGFSKERFPTSMAETYRYLCKLHGYRSEVSDEERMKAIGYSVFCKRPLLLDHAKQVLTQLHPFYRLILATKGDRDVQQSRVEHSGLRSYFHAVYVLEQKTELEIRKIIDECNLDIAKSWSVGNSLRSDIKPALLTGLKAIWVPHDTWVYEEDVQPDSSNFHQVTSLDQVLNVVNWEVK